MGTTEGGNRNFPESYVINVIFPNTVFSNITLNTDTMFLLKLFFLSLCTYLCSTAHLGGPAGCTPGKCYVLFRS